MKIIIDGYNLLRSPFVTKLTPQKLMQFLKTYSAQKKHIIILVFDGGDASWPYKTYKDSLTLIYSGHKSNADLVIKGLIAEECKGKECLIVTSDKDIALYAQKNQVTSIDVDLFYSFLKQRMFSKIPQKKMPSPALKRAGYVSSPELDALMEKSKNFYKAEDEESFSPQPSFSKQDKKIIEI